MKDLLPNKRNLYIKYLKIGLSLLILAVVLYGLWIVLFSSDNVKPVPTRVYPDSSPIKE